MIESQTGTKLLLLLLKFTTKKQYIYLSYLQLLFRSEIKEKKILLLHRHCVSIYFIEQFVC